MSLIATNCKKLPGCRPESLTPGMCPACGAVYRHPEPEPVQEEEPRPSFTRQDLQPAAKKGKKVKAQTEESPVDEPEPTKGEIDG